MIRRCEYSLRSGDEMEGAKGEEGGRYRFQTLVHRHYGKLEPVLSTINTYHNCHIGKVFLQDIESNFGNSIS
jgi:hypothetical protein